MTPTEEKSKEKAEELLNLFDNPTKQWDGTSFVSSLEYKTKCAIICCDQTIDALNSIKGMGKIHKVKFWKLVKKNLEDQ